MYKFLVKLFHPSHFSISHNTINVSMEFHLMLQKYALRRCTDHSYLITYDSKKIYSKYSLSRSILWKCHTETFGMVKKRDFLLTIARVHCLHYYIHCKYKSCLFTRQERKLMNTIGNMSLWIVVRLHHIHLKLKSKKPLNSLFRTYKMIPIQMSVWKMRPFCFRQLVNGNFQWTNANQLYFTLTVLWTSKLNQSTSLNGVNYSKQLKENDTNSLKWKRESSVVFFSCFVCYQVGDWSKLLIIYYISKGIGFHKLDAYSASNSTHTHTLYIPFPICKFRRRLQFNSSKSKTNENSVYYMAAVDKIESQNKIYSFRYFPTLDDWKTLLLKDWHVNQNEKRYQNQIK